jgi:hypothetical protein
MSRQKYRHMCGDPNNMIVISFWTLRSPCWMTIDEPIKRRSFVRNVVSHPHTHSRSLRGNIVSVRTAKAVPNCGELRILEGLSNNHRQQNIIFQSRKKSPKFVSPPKLVARKSLSHIYYFPTRAVKRVARCAEGPGSRPAKGKFSGTKANHCQR